MMLLCPAQCACTRRVHTQGVESMMECDDLMIYCFALYVRGLFGSRAANEQSCFFRFCISGGQGLS